MGWLWLWAVWPSGGFVSWMGSVKPKMVLVAQGRMSFGPSKANPGPTFNP